MDNATAVHTGQLAIHVDLGEVTVKAIDGDRVTVADEFNDTVQVPTDELC